MAKTIYVVLSQSCDDEQASPPVLAWHKKSDASKIAKACAQELFDELEGDEPGKYKIVRTMGHSGVCYTITIAAEDYATNWWYVDKMQLK